MARLKHLNFPISRFDGTGLSSKAVFREKLLAEKERLFTEKFGRLTALRVLAPPEGRSWMLTDVANAAKKDPKLAHFLLCTTAVIARAWRFAFLRNVLHGIDVVLSRLHKQ